MSGVTPDRHQARWDRLAVGSVWSALMWAAGLLTGPVLTVALVRAMGHVEFGALALATSAVGVLAAVAGLGLGAAVTQIAPAERVRSGRVGEAAAIVSAVRLGAKATVATLPLVAGSIWLFIVVPGLRHAMPALLAMAPVAIAAPMLGVLTGAFKVLDQPRQLALRTSAASALTGVAIAAIIIVGHPRSYVVGTAESVGAIATLAFLARPLMTWRRGYSGLSGHAVSNRRLLLFGTALLTGSVFGLVVAELDILLVAAFHTTKLAGLYAPASAAMMFLVTIPTIVGSFYLPTVTGAAVEGDLDGVRDLYRVAMRWSLALVSPALGVILICPGSALSLLFGSGFSTMATPLRILGIGLAIHVLAGFNGMTLDAFGLPKLVAKRQITSIIVSVVACIALIPRFGAVGAAVATTIGIASANVLCSYLLYRRYRVHPFGRKVLSTLVALTVAAGGMAVAVTQVTGDLARCLVVGTGTAAPTVLLALLTADHAERIRVTRLVARSSRTHHSDGSGNGVVVNV